MGTGLVAVLCAAGWLGGVAVAPAGAAGRAPLEAHGHHHPHGRGRGRSGVHEGREHVGGLPAIGHAKDPSREPVVYPDKGKPPATLLVKNLVRGSGTAVTASSVVDVKYVGADYRTGEDFTVSTWTSGRPAEFALQGVIPGFANGLTGMRVGGRREIVIPPRLGYQDRAQGPIKPHETLVFVVDLVAVKA